MENQKQETLLIKIENPTMENIILENKKTYSDYRKKYYKSNKSKIQKEQKKYQSKKKEEISTQKKEYYESNKELIKRKNILRLINKKNHKPKASTLSKYNILKDDISGLYY